jgi:hypothetical protein
MLRRPNIEEPVSRLAAWSGRLALFALVAVLISVLVVRGDLLEIRPALAMFAAALALAGLAMLLSLCAAVVIWRQGLSGIGRATLGFFLGAALLAYPGYLALRAYKLPATESIAMSRSSSSVRATRTAGVNLTTSTRKTPASVMVR